MPRILLDKISKSYDGGQSIAVKELDLQIEDGEFMCLLGPSGCGKTTTLRMIAGLENLTKGEIIVGDRVVDAAAKGVFIPPEQRGIGFVFQSYALWPHLNIEQNTDFGLRMRKIPKKEREERVSHIMKTLGIDQFRDRYPSQLSGGQQQRVALARMLVVNPDVLLLDEPLSNLDSRLRLEMRAELKRIHKVFGTTIIFVTHDQWEAMTLATSIVVMKEGTLQQLGTPEDIYELPANRFVAEFVGNPPINLVDLSQKNSVPFGHKIRDFFLSKYKFKLDISLIGLRPENIILFSEPVVQKENHFNSSAIVTGILPIGGSWIVELEINTIQIFATTNQVPEYKINDQIFFEINLSTIHVFDEKGNRILFSKETE